MRPATADDEAALAELDVRAWSSWTSPLPAPSGPTTFFSASTRPADVLVAEVSGHVVGYVTLGRVLPIEANAHVLQIAGLVVDPALRRQGLARRLVEAALAEARRRGARKLSLRVFAPNTAARDLYESCGFAVEGVLRGEFLLAGTYVDDVLMARHLG